MADKTLWPRSERRWHLLMLVLATCLVFPSRCQDNEVVESQQPAKRLEEAVFTDMLRIVDHKFDTLTTRITSLERAVSNLQFFSIRQFRQISGGLQSTEKDLEAVSKQVDQLQVDGRGLKITMSLLSRDVSELKKHSTDTLSELESSVVYINENLDKQGKFIKKIVEDTVLASTREMTGLLSKQIDEMSIKFGNQLTESPNCTVDYARISRNIDHAFAGFKHETYSYLDDVINSTLLELKTGKENCVEEKIGIIKTQDFETGSEEIRHTGEDSRAWHSERAAELRRGNSDEVLEDASSESVEDSIEYQDENDERVMNALYNMTNSVLQAVSFFRNTGQMLEQIMSNTDVMVSQQAKLARKFGILQVGGLVQDDEDNTEPSNIIPGADGDSEKESLFHGLQPEVRGCALSSDTINNVATIIKNGSQLLEVLTDLAQMSSVSLSKATASLQDEVTRVEGIRTRMATAMLARSSGDKSDPVNRLVNTTQRTFKLMEAVASNTGWLSPIFHNVQHLETLTNRSLHLVTHNHAMLSQIYQVTVRQPSSEDDGRGKARPTLSNRIPRIPSAEGSSDHTEPDSKDDDAILHRESLETIYSTSLQLNRIMPALTRLLAEPDPLITLVGGGRSEQGRVEIYHKGQWGALCHRDLTHQEADIICRHLGLKGGISAGAGHFGAGAGITWTFNASCLATSLCTVVKYSEDPCSHELDAAVICDHMLRINTSEGATRGTVGRLEMHHRGMWLPVCGEGWSGYSARVACKQMGYTDGREVEMGEWLAAANSTWLGKVACQGNETRLDACDTEGWVESCPGYAAAGVRCL